MDGLEELKSITFFPSAYRTANDTENAFIPAAGFADGKKNHLNKAKNVHDLNLENAVSPAQLFCFHCNAESSIPTEHNTFALYATSSLR